MALKRRHGIYDYERVSGLSFNENDPKSQSRTQQHFKDDADIHTIIDRYTRTGLYYDPLNPPTIQPQFGDYTNVDYVNLQNTIAKVNNDFSLLPSEIRRKFNDNPAILLDFLANPENKDEAIKIGLLPHEVVDTPETTPTITTVSEVVAGSSEVSQKTE